MLLAGAVVLYLAAGAVPAGALFGGIWLAAALAYGFARRFHPRAIEPAKLAAVSVALPGIGALLVLPLTIHLLLFASNGDATGFESWVYFSVIFTTVTTIVTGVLIAVRAWLLANDLRIGRVFSPWGIWGIGALAGCVPGIVFVVPAVLIAITGLALVPVLYAMEGVLRHERALLDAVEVPDAVARFREAA